MRDRRLFPVLFGGGGPATPSYLAGGIPAANCIGAYSPKGAASLAVSYANLANPGTHDLTATVAPTFDTATGWTFNGTTQFLKTDIVPTDPKNWTAIVQFSGGTNSATDKILLGQTPGTVGRFLIEPSLSNQVKYWVKNVTSVVAPGLTAGVLGLAGLQGYRNGVPDGTAMSTANIEMTTLPFYIGGCCGSGPTMILPWSGNIQRVFIYDIVLTAVQMAAVFAEIANA